MSPHGFLGALIRLMAVESAGIRSRYVRDRVDLLQERAVDYHPLPNTQFRFLALAIDKKHGRGPSNEMRPQLQPNKAKVRLY